MMLKKRFGSRQAGVFGAMIVIVFLLSACTGNRELERERGQERTVAPDAPSVLILPFENLSEHPGAGRILTRLMGTELYRQKIFRLREELALHRQAHNGEDGGNPYGTQLQLTEKPDMDAVLLGSVTEYRYQHGLREEPVVGLSVRLVRECDRRVVWAASQNISGRGFLHRDSLNQAAQRVVSRLARELEQLDVKALRCSSALWHNGRQQQESLS